MHEEQTEDSKCYVNKHKQISVCSLSIGTDRLTEICFSTVVKRNVATQFFLLLQSTQRKLVLGGLERLGTRW